jgi:hypothetical protein
MLEIIPHPTFQTGFLISCIWLAMATKYSAEELLHSPNIRTQSPIASRTRYKNPGTQWLSKIFFSQEFRGNLLQLEFCLHIVSSDADLQAK